MRNENACLVVKTLIENHKQITRPQPIGKESNPQNALKGVGQLKFHTGEFATGAKMAECSLLIKSPINALRSGGGRFLCLFPPSGYSQNRALDMKCCHRRPANKSTRPQPSSGHRWLSNEGNNISSSNSPATKSKMNRQKSPLHLLNKIILDRSVEIFCHFFHVQCRKN